MQHLQLQFRRGVVTLSTLFTVLANLISLDATVFLIVSAAFVDVYRHRKDRIKVNVGNISIVTVLTSDVTAAIIVIITVMLLAVLWLLLPSYCPEVLNSWIEGDFAFAFNRIATLGTTCSVAHGSIVLPAQAVLPILALLVISSNMIHLSVNPISFGNNTIWMIKLKSYSDAKTIAAIVLFPLLFFTNNVMAPTQQVPHSPHANIFESFISTPSLEFR